MPFSRERYPKEIADRLHLLADMLKTRSRAWLTDANHSLETVMERFFNALLSWELVNLNAGQGGFSGSGSWGSQTARGDADYDVRRRNRRDTQVELLLSQLHQGREKDSRH